MMATFGDFAVLDAAQFSVQRYDAPEYTVPKVIVLWGNNPAPGCPDGFYGHWIIDCMKRGSRLVVVDPRWTWFASRRQCYSQAGLRRDHLPLFHPGDA